MTKLKKRITEEQLETLLNSKATAIAKLVAETSQKGKWTLLATLRGEYSIKTTAKQYCPKGQDKIKDPHYEFAVRLKEKALDELLGKPKWAMEIAKKLLKGIAGRIEMITWY
jgi:hypothetical protein